LRVPRRQTPGLRDRQARGRARRIIGIGTSAKPAQTRAQISRIARGTARLIGVERELHDDEIELGERYHAGCSPERAYSSQADPADRIHQE